MDEGIELQLNNLRLVIQNLEQPSLAAAPPDEEPTETNDDENGAVLFNREWQNRYAEERKQKLTIAFGGGIQNGFRLNIAAEGESENLTKLSLDDLISLVTENEDFADFRSQPKEFWQQVRRMSATTSVQGNENKTLRISRYDNFLIDMRDKKLSPQEYARTLPSNQQAVFLADFQMEKTFGANIFENGSIRLSDNEQVRGLEFPNDDAARLEILSGEKNIIVFAPSNSVAPNSKDFALDISTSRKNYFDVTSQPVSAAIFTKTTESSAARASSANAALENANVVNGISRRDAGAAIGGALINGAFASIDFYQNLENDEIKGSLAVGNNFGGFGRGFAAGAIGAMFGAAIGGVIPGAGTDVSGILGFVSGVVIGVEANEGLRWLGADKTISGANSRAQLTADNSFAPILNFQPVLA